MKAKLKKVIKAEKRAKAHTRRIWKQKKMWYKKIIRAVTYSIDNPKELKKLKKKERQTQISVTEFSEIITNPEINAEINWSALGAPDNLN